ncbi:hypothetical protein JCM9157_1908 [Halalkalibacter akibai JCM 9157]|uniref:Tr-type G domain-containing protein n=2 Tax=Halalkalibacter akibai TaxID=1411 RepID=W4QT67_HALA3|nr:hypothetical protein JCM9157_1908 [Halalkalibacter akibai JCM 9157]
MTLENKLIQKTYYKQFIENQEKKEGAILKLANSALEELKNELPDLSQIRFSQGELYYQLKDYEAAIFKWENIHNDLKPWAQKNMADAYYELNMLAEAEELYQSVESDHLTLNTEVLLQLFSLYMDMEQLEQSANIIKRTVDLNPDYPNVTTIARSFFEEYKDYSSLIELTVNETLRTESIEWFQTLHEYVKQKMTKTTSPDYFLPILQKLADVDQVRFEQMVLAFWNSYQNGPFYFEWLKQFNELFKSTEVYQSNLWIDLSKKYEQSYFSLIDGSFYINEIRDVVPNLLENWLKISHQPEATAAAVLAWEETFPESFIEAVVDHAIKVKSDLSAESNLMQHSLQLFEAICKWANEHDVEVSNYLNWSVEQLLDGDSHNLLIAGSSGNGKTAFINSLFGETILESSYSTIVFQNQQELEIRKITESQIATDVTLEEFKEITTIRRQPHLVDVRLPSPFLKQNNVAIIHTPIYNGDSEGKESHMLHLADCLLYVLNANTPFTDEERQVLLNISQHAPSLPIHFILNKIDVLNEQEAKRVIEDTSARVQSVFPNAKVLAYSSLVNKHQYKLVEMIKEALPKQRKSTNAKLLHFIRKTITYLLKKRVDLENELIDSVHWNEEAVLKLNGAIHQLEDLEKEKVAVIKNAYQKIKVDTKNQLKAAVPELLRECANLVDETSDFKKLHLELNKEMNKKIQQYIQSNLLPAFSDSIQQWLEKSNVEFIQTQSYLKEMCEGFNAYYREERFKFNCDFRVLDDWYRDIDRMTNGVYLDDINVLLRLTPSQLLLKSSGKFFGVFPTNKTLLANLYKKFIENENYEQVTDTITNQFMMQFDMFEKGLQRDISLSFRSPFTAINEAIREAELEIVTTKESLKKLRANPEIYIDPLTLFKLKLRQQELMIETKQTPQLLV